MLYLYTFAQWDKWLMVTFEHIQNGLQVKHRNGKSGTHAWDEDRE